jgi:hypothetical protein
MRGQMRIEFIVSLVLFVLIIVYIVSQTNSLFSSLLTDSRIDNLKAKSFNVMKVLVEDVGNPQDWQTVSDSSIKRIGLVNNYQPYNLSKAKINRLASGNNCSHLEKFDLKAYRLKIYNSTHRILFCGFDSLEPPTATEIKYVFIDGGFGNISLELW